MSAILIVDEKRVLDNGRILQIKVWQLPHWTPERPHGLKYSLFYGEPGHRIVGYDNERGKGDHRHYGSIEEPYVFNTLQELFADFLNDVDLRERQP